MDNKNNTVLAPTPLHGEALVKTQESEKPRGGSGARGIKFKLVFGDPATALLLRQQFCPQKGTLVGLTVIMVSCVIVFNSCFERLI